MRCGKEKESTQQLAISTPAKTVYRKGRKDRKEWKKTGRQFRKLDEPRYTHRNGGLRSSRPWR
jgi:hypothetical protein